MAKYTVAVVGCGRISQTHLKGFHEYIDGIYVKYACDLILEKAEAAKAKYPDMIGECITDYKIALADPEVEAVYVLTPNFAHYTVTMDALRAGKHVLCEKPITVNYALSCEMKEEADKRGLMLNIGVCNRHHASVEKLAEMCRNGDFGDIYHIVCSFRACRSIPGLGGDFTTKAASGGGALIDWGVHFLDLILYVLGGAKLKTVTCDTYCEMAKDMKSYKYKGAMWAEDTMNLEGTNDVDDYVTGYVRTDKASISINGAWAQNLDIGEMYVDFLGDKKGARLQYQGMIQVFDGQTLETEHPEYDIPNQYLAEDKAFLDSIDTGVKTRGNIDNVLESAKLLDMLYQSADAHKELEADKVTFSRG